MHSGIAAVLQKIEKPARKREGVDSYEERKGKGDDVLTSPELNKDTELFGTEVGVADAMRFQVLPDALNSCICRLLLLVSDAGLAGRLCTNSTVTLQHRGVSRYDSHALLLPAGSSS